MRYSTRYAPVALLGLLLVGCSDTGPAPDTFDPTTTEADMLAIEAVFQTPAFESLAALGQYFTIPAPFAARSAAMLEALPDAHNETGGRRLASLAVSLTSALTTMSVEAIPEEYRGLTFVWDEEESAYVLDPDRAGPENGIRFVLYAVDPITQKPASPLNELGYVDLLDESTETAAVIRLVVVSSEVTHLDYAVGIGGTPTTPVLTAEGFISDGPTVVEFSLTSASTITIVNHTVELDYSLSVPSLDYQIDVAMMVTGGDGSESMTIEATINRGDVTIAVGGSVTNNVGTIEIEINDELFAIIEYDGSDVLSVTDAAGEPLGEEQQAALHEILNLINELFRAAERLFQPVQSLFGI